MPVHPAIVHFPIALVFAAFLAELLGARRKDQRLRDAAWWALLGAAGSANVAVMAGLYDMEKLGAHDDLVHVHMQVGLGLLLGLVALVAWRWRLRRRGDGVGAAYLGALSLALVGISVQGWLGGELVFGRGAGVQVAQNNGGGHEHGPGAQPKAGQEHSVHSPREGEHEGAAGHHAGKDAPTQRTAQAHAPVDATTQGTARAHDATTAAPAGGTAQAHGAHGAPASSGPAAPPSQHQDHASEPGEPPVGRSRAAERHAAPEHAGHDMAADANADANDVVPPPLYPRPAERQLVVPAPSPRVPTTLRRRPTSGAADPQAPASAPYAGPAALRPGPLLELEQTSDAGTHAGHGGAG